MSHEDASEFFDVPLQTISDLMTGEIGEFDLETLVQMAVTGRVPVRQYIIDAAKKYYSQKSD